MLEAIVQEKRREVAAAMARRPLADLAAAVTPANHAFRRALEEIPWALVAECKLASPVKGVFRHGRTVAELAAVYAASGAAALSVLTDRHFCGCLADIGAAKAACSLPVLRKDFVVHEYQVYEARAAGADAVLLIAAVLPPAALARCCALAQSLGMDVLVEVHDVRELAAALPLPEAIIGINNRDLKTFTTDLTVSETLLARCPPGRLVISESGITTATQARMLRAWGARGILVGEGLVTAPNIAARTRELALRGDAT